MRKRPVELVSIADGLEDLAERLGRLTISRRNPEAFFEERSELVDQILQHAAAARFGQMRRYNEALRKTQEELREVQNVGEEAFGTFIDALTQGGDLVDNLASGFAGLGKQLASLGAQKLFASLFGAGEKGGNLAEQIGGVLSVANGNRGGASSYIPTPTPRPSYESPSYPYADKYALPAATPSRRSGGCEPETTTPAFAGVRPLRSRGAALRGSSPCPGIRRDRAGARWRWLSHAQSPAGWVARRATRYRPAGPAALDGCQWGRPTG